MVAPFVKALGAVVVGAPVAVVLGLTARSLKKQEDADVPVVRAQESPLAVIVYSNYLDKKTHQHLAPTSMKPGYVAYDIRVENHTATPAKGVHLELLDGDGAFVGVLRLGDIEAYGRSVFVAKKSWNAALESTRVHGKRKPRGVLTWRTPEGRRRAVLSLRPQRVLGPTPGEIRRGRRQKAPVVSQVMS